MLAIDYIILNRDRHGANIEVLRNKKNHTIRLAPLFDHGLSLIFNCYSEENIKKFDVLEDKPINSYIGSKSSKDNLELIKENKFPRFNLLSEKDKDIIFTDLHGILSEYMIEKIWEMIYTRWRYYEDFCNTRK